MHLLPSSIRNLTLRGRSASSICMHRLLRDICASCRPRNSAPMTVCRQKFAHTGVNTNTYRARSHLVAATSAAMSANTPLHGHNGGDEPRSKKQRTLADGERQRPLQRTVPFICVLLRIYLVLPAAVQHREGVATGRRLHMHTTPAPYAH